MKTEKVTRKSLNERPINIKMKDNKADHVSYLSSGAVSLNMNSTNEKIVSPFNASRKKKSPTRKRLEETKSALATYSNATIDVERAADLQIRPLKSLKKQRRDFVTNRISHNHLFNGRRATINRNQS